MQKRSPRLWYYAEAGCRLPPHDDDRTKRDECATVLPMSRKASFGMQPHVVGHAFQSLAGSRSCALSLHMATATPHNPAHPQKQFDCAGVARIIILFSGTAVFCNEGATACACPTGSDCVHRKADRPSYTSADPSQVETNDLAGRLRAFGACNHTAADSGCRCLCDAFVTSTSTRMFYSVLRLCLQIRSCGIVNSP